MNQDKTLTVYKASAGSGKTFTLSVEYIKLLMDNPMNYRHILAVTFTNKATEEMKTRILSQLYGIWKKLPESKGYMEKIVADTGHTEQYLSERAGWALTNIVNNYSYFRIETIDSFFQSVLRNLARELDLTANLRVELNDTQIEQNAVDELIEGLGKNDELLKWIMDYIKENIDDDKNWNVIGQIKDFGKNIFKEFYKTHSKRLNEVLLRPGFFKDFTAKLYKARNEAEKCMKETGQAFFDTLEENGIGIADLKNKEKGPAGYFMRLRNGVFDESIVKARVKNVIDNGGFEEWTSKTANSQIRQLASEVLSPMLAKAEEKRKQCWNAFTSANLTLRHISQLRLLNSIEHKVRDMNAEANRFLLSDTHTLLHTLIKGTDTPFIFEKIGTQLESIMIDEFQDTSTIQWQNFKVLLEECMDKGHGRNLIVGDVKQSIYRWRSGDWRMLNNIEQEFYLKRDSLEVRPLDTNYRSERRVVEFNNQFFTLASQIEYDTLKDDNDAAQQLKKAYDDVVQCVPQSRKETGYVKIDLIAANDNEAQELMLKKSADMVKHLLDAGVKPKDIAVLVRQNSTIQMIADYFAEAMPDVKMVSDEAFRLDNSVTANIIVNAMHLLSHPDDVLTKAFIAKAYQTRVLGKHTDTDSELLNSGDMTSLLPKEFVNSHTKLRAMPLFELAERLYRIFNLKQIEGEDAYIFAFYDHLNNFIANNSADIDDFVNEWNENIHEKTIQMSDVEGVRLITIHKSKGLEFAHVVIPFCDWRLEKTNVIWCSPNAAPYNELPLVPIDYSTKKLLGTIYENDYHTEHLQNCVDNLNLLYVAFTRASKSLVVMAKRGNTNMRSSIIEECLKRISLAGGILDGDFNDKKSDISYEFGEIDSKGSKEKGHSSENVFLPDIKNLQVEVKTFENNTEFKQSNQSKDFVNDDDDSKQDTYIKTGRLLHYLFSTITTTEDIDKSITEMEMQGLLTDDVSHKESLRKMLHKRLETPQVADWFSGKWRLFNECNILYEDPTSGEVRNERPDRVMTDGKKYIVVDFKFGNEKAEHHDQVSHYVDLIRAMGHNDVEGFLWYVYSNKIVEVR